MVAGNLGILVHTRFEEKGEEEEEKVITLMQSGRLAFFSHTIDFVF